MVGCRHKLACGSVCGEQGHTSATCPHRPCVLCGELSNPRHTKRSCPSQHTGVRHCSDCGHAGHHRGPSCPKYQPPWRLPDAEAKALLDLPPAMDAISYSGPAYLERSRVSLWPKQRPGAPRGGQGMMQHTLMLHASCEVKQGQFRVSDRRKRGRRSDYGVTHVRKQTVPVGYSLVYADRASGKREPSMVPEQLCGVTRQPSMVLYYGAKKQKVTSFLF
jgi:hypothetical protein